MRRAQKTTPTGDARQQSAGDWQARAKAAMKTTPGKHISAVRMAKVEKGAANRVPTKVFRAWAATLVDEGTIQVKQGPTTYVRSMYNDVTGQVKLPPPRELQLGTAARRQHTKHMHEDTLNGHMHRILDKVRRWLLKRVSGAKDPKVTQAMVADLEHSYNKAGRTAPQIRAALMYLSVQEQIPVQWKVMGRGRTTKDGIAEAQDELRKWLGAARAAAIATQARGRGRGSTKTTGTVTQETIDTQPYAMLDFGQGWDGMKEGASRVMPVFGSDRKRQYKGWKEGYTIPDMLGDFTSTQDNLIVRASKRAKLTTHNTTGAHFSFDCTPETIINAIEKTNGRGRGTWANKQREQAQDCTIMKVATDIVAYAEANPRWSWTIEQPAESAVKGIRIMRKLGKPIRVNMCTYGYKHCKPSIIYTNLYPRYWKPRSFTKGRCKWCEACNSGTLHEEWIVRRGADDHRKRAGTATMRGFTFEAAKNRIAPDLAEELARAMQQKWDVTQHSAGKAGP